MNLSKLKRYLTYVLRWLLLMNRSSQHTACQQDIAMSALHRMPDNDHPFHGGHHRLWIFYAVSPKSNLIRHRCDISATLYKTLLLKKVFYAMYQNVTIATVDIYGGV